MKRNISKNQFRVMAYLHENARGFSENFSFSVKDTAPALSIKTDQLQRQLTRLAGLGLVGTSTQQRLLYGNRRSDLEFYLTSSGEDFMRELDEMLGNELQTGPDAGQRTAERVTLKTAGFVYDSGKAVIAKALSDWLTDGH